MAVTVEYLCRQLSLPVPDDTLWRTAVVGEVVSSRDPAAASSVPEGHVRVNFLSQAESFDEIDRGAFAQSGKEVLIVPSAQPAGRAVEETESTLCLEALTETFDQNLLSAKLIVSQDRAAEARRVLEDVMRLTKVATGGDATAVLADLASLIRGWAVVVDPDGQVMASAGAGSIHKQEAISLAVGTPVKRRDVNAQRHPIGAGRRNVGVLVVSGRTRSISRIRALSQHAAALLNLTLHVHDHGQSETTMREVICANLAHPEELSRGEVSRKLGLRSEWVRAFQVSIDSSTVDLENLVSRWLQQIGSTLLYFADRRAVCGWISAGNTDPFVLCVSDFNESASAKVRLGLSDVHPPERSHIARAEARFALSSASREGQRVHYKDLSTSMILKQAYANGLEPESFLELDPLAKLNPNRELREALFHYLNSNGALGQAASSMGVHRHTMRSYVRMIETQSGLDLGSMSDRVVAWNALLVHPTFFASTAE